MRSHQAASLLCEESIAQVRSYLLYYSTNKMVNFGDPFVFIRESGACAHQTFSRSQKVTGLTSQSESISFGVLWMASSCGPVSYRHFAVSMCHITQFAPL